MHEAHTSVEPGGQALLNPDGGVDASATAPHVFPGTEAIEAPGDDGAFTTTPSEGPARPSWAERRAARKAASGGESPRAPGLPWDTRVKIAVVVSFVVLVAVLILNRMRGQGRTALPAKIPDAKAPGDPVKKKDAKSKDAEKPEPSPRDDPSAAATPSPDADAPLPPLGGAKTPTAGADPAPDPPRDNQEAPPPAHAADRPPDPPVTTLDKEAAPPPIADSPPNVPAETKAESGAGAGPASPPPADAATLPAADAKPAVTSPLPADAGEKPPTVPADPPPSETVKDKDAPPASAGEIPKPGTTPADAAPPSNPPQTEQAKVEPAKAEAAPAEPPKPAEVPATMPVLSTPPASPPEASTPAEPSPSATPSPSAPAGAAFPIRNAGMVRTGTTGARTARALDAQATRSAAEGPVAAPGPAAPEDGAIHVVRRGENFWTISRYHYGSGRFYMALWDANRDVAKQPEDLYVGTAIRIPPVEDLKRNLIEPPRTAKGKERPSADAKTSANARRDLRTERTSATRGATLPIAKETPERTLRREAGPTSRTYVVRGRYETLRSIARDQLGDAEREDEIYQLNRDAFEDDAPHLESGMKLRLPKRGSED